MPLTSIIIPNYNYRKFLPRAVESLAEQTYNRMELIIVDDGSSDDSREFIESLKGFYRDRFERFESLLLEENRGKLHALNRGIPLIHGEITIILDADDYLEIDYITEIVDILIDTNAKNKMIGFVYTDCWLVNSAGDMLARGKSTSFDKKLLKTSSYIPTCAPIFTSILQDVLPFDERILIGVKHHMWKKIINAGWEGLYLAKPLFYYRMHDQNLSGIGKKVLNDVERATTKVYILSGYWPKGDLKKGV